MLLSDLLTAERVKIPLAAQSRDAVLEELVEVLRATGAVEDVEPVLRAVRERETLGSTGFGGGVAIPHGRAAGIAGVAVAAGVVRPPLDFDAVDGRPVELVFLLVGPQEAAAAHLQALAGISRLLRRERMREALCSAGSPQEFIAAVLHAEVGAEAA